MTLLDLKKAIYAFAGRSVGDDSTVGSTAELVQNGVDLCLLAINQARLKAQREYDFLTLEDVFVGVANATTGCSLDTGFKTSLNAAAATVLKSITGVFETSTDDSTLVALGKSYTFESKNKMFLTSGVVTTRKFAYVRGRKLFLENAGDTYVAVTAMPFLADLADDDDPDFFLTFGYDWLLLESVRQLNMLIKEDQRVAVPQRQLDEAWRSLTRLDLDTSNWTDLE